MSIRDSLDQLGIRVDHLHEGENRTGCPWCAKAGHDEALAVRVDGGSAVYQCFRCGTSGRVSESARTIGAPAKRAAVKLPKRDDAKMRQVAAEIWAQTTSLADTAGSDYLEMRACALPPADGDLRYHPSLFCAKDGNRHPALVARVSTVVGNRFVGVHRIYLEPGSDTAIAKLRLGGSDAAVCVRLWPDDTVEATLTIAEGIESALAAATLQRPAWATIDAGQMAKFPVLAGVSSLTVYVDNDPVGIKAANDCADRWKASGREVRARKPRIAGLDVNDVIRRGRHECA